MMTAKRFVSSTSTLFSKPAEKKIASKFMSRSNSIDYVFEEIEKGVKTVLQCIIQKQKDDDNKSSTVKNPLPENIVEILVNNSQLPLGKELYKWYIEKVDPQILAPDDQQAVLRELIQRRVQNHQDRFLIYDAVDDLASTLRPVIIQIAAQVQRKTFKEFATDFMSDYLNEKFQIKNNSRELKRSVGGIQALKDSDVAVYGTEDTLETFNERFIKTPGDLVDSAGLLAYTNMIDSHGDSRYLKFVKSYLSHENYLKVHVICGDSGVDKITTALLMAREGVALSKTYSISICFLFNTLQRVIVYT
jgi:hypothetical protein